MTINNKFLLINIIVKFELTPILLDSIKRMDQEKIDVLIYDFRCGEDKKNKIETDYDIVEFDFDQIDSLQELIKKETAKRQGTKAILNVDGESVYFSDEFLDFVTSDLFDDENVGCVYSDYVGITEECKVPIYLHSMPVGALIPLLVCDSEKYLKEDTKKKIENVLLSKYISIHIPKDLYKSKINVKK